jgi:hypothetical protein
MCTFANWDAMRAMAWSQLATPVNALLPDTRRRARVVPPDGRRWPSPLSGCSRPRRKPKKASSDSADGEARSNTADQLRSATQ